MVNELLFGCGNGKLDWRLRYIGAVLPRWGAAPSPCGGLCGLSRPAPTDMAHTTKKRITAEP